MVVYYHPALNLLGSETAVQLKWWNRRILVQKLSRTTTNNGVHIDESAGNIFVTFVGKTTPTSLNVQILRRFYISNKMSMLLILLNDTEYVCSHERYETVRSIEHIQTQNTTHFHAKL